MRYAIEIQGERPTKKFLLHGEDGELRTFHDQHDAHLAAQNANSVKHLARAYRIVQYGYVGEFRGEEFGT